MEADSFFQVLQTQYSGQLEAFWSLYFQIQGTLARCRFLYLFIVSGSPNTAFLSEATRPLYTVFFNIQPRFEFFITVLQLVRSYDSPSHTQIFSVQQCQWVVLVHHLSSSHFISNTIIKHNHTATKLLSFSLAVLSQRSLLAFLFIWTVVPTKID